MSPDKKDIFVCGESFFCSVFKQAGCTAVEENAGREEILKRMKEENPAFFIFSQSAFGKMKRVFSENFIAAPYIVFPMPGEENLIEHEISELVKIAVGVEL